MSEVKLSENKRALLHKSRCITFSQGGYRAADSFNWVSIIPPRGTPDIGVVREGVNSSLREHRNSVNIVGVSRVRAVRYLIAISKNAKMGLEALQR